MKILERFEPRDAVAMLLILGVIILNFRGLQLMLPQAILLVIGYYYGHQSGYSAYEKLKDS